MLVISQRHHTIDNQVDTVWAAPFEKSVGAPPDIILLSICGLSWAGVSIVGIDKLCEWGLSMIM